MFINHKKKSYGYLFGARIGEKAYGLIVPFSGSWKAKVYMQDTSGNEVSYDIHFFSDHISSKIMGKEAENELLCLIREILKNNDFRLILATSDVPSYVRKMCFEKIKTSD